MGQNITIIADFSKTLTASTNPTTWSSLALSGLLGTEYIKERDLLYKKNYKHEKEGNQEKTRAWFASHLALMRKYGLTQKIINQLVLQNEFFQQREGIQEFFKYIDNNSIQLVIITSGISNLVSAFLESLDISVDNIQIIGNELIMNSDGQVVGYNEKSVFTPLDDKGSFMNLLHVSQEDYVYLLGDKIEDLAMYKGAFSIGFNEESIGYNINLGKQGDLIEVIDIFNKNRGDK